MKNTIKKLTISMNEETKEVLEKASSRYGVTQSGYISMLIRRAEIEYNTSKFLEQMTPEQMREALEEARHKVK